jgi:hypothetical protein
LNEQIQSRLRGESEQSDGIQGDLSRIWSQLCTVDPDPEACATLSEVLEIRNDVVRGLR